MGWTDNPSHYRLLSQIRSPAHSSPLILISELVITGQLLAAPILWRYSEQSARPLTSIVTFVRVMSSCLQMVILLLHPHSIVRSLSYSSFSHWRGSSASDPRGRLGYRVEECWQCLLSILTKHNDPLNKIFDIERGNKSGVFLTGPETETT